MANLKEYVHSIAIVGAGIGGASTSFFLSELFSKNQITVDLYESDVVGGRIRTDVINGLRFDTGAPVLHEEQQHMSYFRELLGLEKRKSYLTGGLGYFDGKTYVPYNDTLLGPHKVELNKYVDNLISKFRKIYEYQKEKKCFEDVHSMMQGLDPDLKKTLTVSTREAVLKEGLPESFVDLIVASGTYRDYQMGPFIHQFVGTYAQCTSQPRLWRIEGGNYLVPDGLVKKSGANLIPHRVQEVQLNSDGTFNLTANNYSKTYDFVVIATPITEDHKNPIVFKQFPEIIHVPGQYKPLILSLVHGKLNPKYFGLSKEEDLPVCVFNYGGSCFNTLCRTAPAISKDGPIEDFYYGITSLEHISEEELGKMFLEKSDVHVYDYLANPSYDTSGRNDKFVLHKNLFHISAIEWIASGMEMSCIAGKNIALLIYNSLFPTK